MLLRGYLWCEIYCKMFMWDLEACTLYKMFMSSVDQCVLISGDRGDTFAVAGDRTI